MTGKKVLKIFGISVLVLVLIAVGLFSYAYYQMSGKYSVNESKYPAYIGKIDPEKALYTENFELCNPKSYPVGFYSSAAPRIYKGSKRSFLKRFKAQYKITDTTSSGYLNLRFNINCKGQTGNLVVEELNSDLVKVDLDDKIVKDLIEFALQKENWHTYKEATSSDDYYMYLIFKIESGNVTEIIP